MRLGKLTVEVTDTSYGPAPTVTQSDLIFVDMDQAIGTSLDPGRYIIIDPDNLPADWIERAALVLYSHWETHGIDLEINWPESETIAKEVLSAALHIDQEKGMRAKRLRITMDLLQQLLHLPTGASIIDARRGDFETIDLLVIDESFPLLPENAEPPLVELIATRIESEWVHIDQENPE
jgi:hypothetical protein